MEGLISREDLAGKSTEELESLRDTIAEALTTMSVELSTQNLEQLKYRKESNPVAWNEYLSWRQRTVREKGLLENNIRRVRSEIERRIGARSEMLRSAAAILFGLQDEGVLNDQESNFVQLRLRPYVDKISESLDTAAEPQRRSA